MITLTLGLMLVLKRTIGVRVDEDLEATGLGLHSGTAYHSAGIG